MRLLALTLMATVGLAATARADEVALGSVAVKGSAQATALSGVVLQRGVRYRLEVSGTSNVSAGDASSSFDALYCFASSSSQCAQPFREPAAFSIGFASDSAEPRTESFVEFTDAPYPEYSGGHVYSGRFTPVVAGRLFLKAWPGYDPDDTVSRQGTFTVTIYGPGDAGCPEDNQPGDDSGTCDWRARWDVALNYRPKPGEGPSDIDRIQVKAAGDIQFDRKLKADRWATGEPSGKFVLVIRYRAEANINNGIPIVSTYRFRLDLARVRYARSGRNIDFDASLGTVSHPAGGVGCAPGTPVAIKLLQRGGRGNDTISIHVQDPYCLRFDGGGGPCRCTSTSR